MKSGYPVLTFTAGEGFPGICVQCRESATLFIADNIPRGAFLNKVRRQPENCGAKSCKA